MTSLNDRHRAWHAKTFFLNISLLIFSNFNHDQLVLKSKFKGLKWQLSSKITEKLLNDVSKGRQMSETWYFMKRKIQNVPLMMINNFNFFLSTMIKISLKTSESVQNDANVSKSAFSLISNIKCHYKRHFYIKKMVNYSIATPSRWSNQSFSEDPYSCANN